MINDLYIVFKYFLETILVPVVEASLQYATLIGIFVTTIIAYKTYGKHINLSINNERLQFVYFPLKSKFQNNVIKTPIDAFILYAFINKNIQDEKYKALLGANVLSKYRLLEICFKEGCHQQILLRYANQLVRGIDKEYKRVKKFTGYESRVVNYNILFFLIWYWSFIFSAILLKNNNDISFKVAIALMIIGFFFLTVNIVLTFLLSIKVIPDIVFLIHSKRLRRSHSKKKQINQRENTKNENKENMSNLN